MESLKVLLGHIKEGTFYEIIEDWKWILGYSRKYKKAILVYMILGILSTTLGLLSSVAGKYLIDIITGYQMERLGLLAAVMVGGAVVSLLFQSLTNRISVRLSTYINNDIRSDIFDQIMDADWLSIHRFSNGDVLNRFNGDVNTVSSNAISWIPSVVIALYNFAATFIVIMHYDVIMALIAFAAAPLTLLFSSSMIRKQREHNKKVREMSSKMMTFEVEAFYNMDTIKSFGVMSYYGRKMREWQERHKKVVLDYNMFSIWTHVVMSVIGLIVQYSAFGYCLFRLWTHDITYGTMTLFLQQRSNLSSAFNSIVSIVPAFLNSSVSARRIRELVELPREVHIPGSSGMDVHREHGFTVKMADASYSYVEEKPVITDSDFTASPGEIVALVGPSGEGKTTMIRLILGLIYPGEGAVSLCALDGSEVPMNADTRHLFAYVPQGNTILQGTIEENMRLVKEDATEEEIIEALKVSCAWDFVKELPEGIYNSVGERGRGLSEGQAQRLAIARAILRDAPVLLLDEATSALDVTTERQVLKNIMKKHPNKTCIVTTHRPSVLNLCQRVYRVVDTKVTELSEEESAKMAMDF